MRCQPVLWEMLFACTLGLVGEAAASTEMCGDHDGNGSIATSDALRLLRKAVGQDVTIECPEVCLPASCGDGSCNGDETCQSCASECGACSVCTGAGDATTVLDTEEETLLDLLNAYRDDAGKAPVENCTSLSRAAQGHSEDMRDHNYFSTTGFDGSDPWDRACGACYGQGCGPIVPMAEDIAAGNPGAAATLQQWKSNSQQNAHLLSSSFVRVGIGRATGGGSYGTYWTLTMAGATEASCN